MVPAYRAEGSLENPKIVTDSDGAYKGLSEDAYAEGISISFKDDTHGTYYSEGRALFITMDIKDELYEATQLLIKNKRGSVSDTYKKLSKPSPCSDPVMKKLGMNSKNVLTFSKDWTPVIAKAIKVISVSILAEEEIDDTTLVVVNLGDEEEPYWSLSMSKSEAEESGFDWISEARAKKEGIAYDE